MTDPSKRSQIMNARVTTAILRAEGLLKDAEAAWLKVAAAECAIAESKDPSITDVERDIAWRGVGHADAVCAVLRGLNMRAT